MFCVFFRPGGGCVQGAGPQLPPVLPLPLSLGEAPRAAVLSAHRPHSAGSGRHRSTGREHKDPVLPRYLRTPHAAAEREHLWRVWWVLQLEIWLDPLDKLSCGSLVAFGLLPIAPWNIKLLMSWAANVIIHWKFSQYGSCQTFNYVILVTLTICSSLLLEKNGQRSHFLGQAIQFCTFTSDVL